MNFNFQLPMALKPATQFPLFLPPQPPHPLRPSTNEIRFSRWNNANAEKFIREERTQKELEDQLRFQKRFDSALTIAHNYNPAPPHLTTSTKSIGTPSSPSSPSLPGKFSKYSKPPPENLHPAFKPLLKSCKINPNPQTPNFKIDENGVSYELPEAPFLYQYSYTETPKVKPIKLREPLVSPFGPESMAKPWLGRKPLPPSKKKLPEFDSFQLPPPHKKGMKPVQSPGPFLPGSGPKYVRSREEIQGEPLTKVEVEELVKGCQRSSRQLNMGRDGLTHNMLENIHAHWKRRRVCKIKCKGVCTVDMDNICQQLEERTGGKIIYNRGGVIYLFRGRNYNFKSRPRYPLMLWKPVSPVYPRLIKHAPEGLTLVEATEMRKKGRDLTPICKLAKNGVYGDLVKNIREAFEACELVRINCQGMNPSDYRKIGAKLKDLVPCVLISFEHEHILIWRGRNWRSSILEIEESLKGSQEKVNSDDVALGSFDESITESKNNNLGSVSFLTHENGDSEETSDCTEIPAEDFVSKKSEMSSESIECSETGPNFSVVILEQLDELNNEHKAAELAKTSAPWSEAVLLLRKQAVENGMAFVLDNNSLDADIVFKQSVDFAKTVQPGPLFRHRRKELAVQKVEEQECEKSEVKEAPAAVSGTTNVSIVSAKIGERKTTRDKKLKDIKVDYLNVVPQGNLRVDELAKLLA